MKILEAIHDQFFNKDNNIFDSNWLIGYFTALDNDLKILAHVCFILDDYNDTRKYYNSDELKVTAEIHTHSRFVQSFHFQIINRICALCYDYTPAPDIKKKIYQNKKMQIKRSLKSLVELYKNCNNEIIGALPCDAFKTHYNNMLFASEDSDKIFENQLTDLDNKIKEFDQLVAKNKHINNYRNCVSAHIGDIDYWLKQEKKIPLIELRKICKCGMDLTELFYSVFYFKSFQSEDIFEVNDLIRPLDIRWNKIGLINSRTDK